MDIENNSDTNQENSFNKNLTRDEFKRLANDFLVQTEKEDEQKMPWEKHNHVPILHNSLNEFYIWLDKNYW